MPSRLPSGYTARAATPGDAPAVAACVRAAYAHYPERNGLIPVPMRQDYVEVIRDYDVTVIEEDGEIVAAMALGVTDEGFLLDNVAVRPDRQGLGLGRYLLGHAEAEARRLGYDSIYLYAQEIMVENLALYRSIGYVEYARRVEHGLPRVYLRKPL
jgi:ribosomal protein S18 acetylase RimI-like enzyme